MPQEETNTALQSLLGGAGGLGLGALAGGAVFPAVGGAQNALDLSGSEGLRRVPTAVKGALEGVGEAAMDFMPRRANNAAGRQSAEFGRMLAALGAVPGAAGGLTGGAIARGLSSSGKIDSRAGSAGVGATSGATVGALLPLAFALLTSRRGEIGRSIKGVLPAAGASAAIGGLGGGIAGAAMHKNRPKEAAANDAYSLGYADALISLTS